MWYDEDLRRVHDEEHAEALHCVLDAGVLPMYLPMNGAGQPHVPV